jgi:hypothetical protein
MNRRSKCRTSITARKAGADEPERSISRPTASSKVAEGNHAPAESEAGRGRFQISAEQWAGRCEGSVSPWLQRESVLERAQIETDEMMQLRLFTVHEMALSERQQTAERLMHWLQGMGAFVTNPMPLDPGQPGLRFQVLNEDRDLVLSQLREQDWVPSFVSVNLRVCPDGVLRPCTTYQLDLAREQPVVQDRTIRGELADPAKKAAEKAALDTMYKSIYGGKRR